MNTQQTQKVETAQQMFLQKLRTGTDEMHKRLEATQLSANLMKPGVSVAAYTAYLQHMRDVIAFCEDNVFPVIAHVIDNIDDRRKLPLIDKDLHILNIHSAGLHGKKYNAVVNKQDIPFALGFMYVVEGSTLGGRVMLNHLGKALGIDETGGAAFFAGYGPQTGKMWKEFINTLSDYAVTHNEAEAIIAGARYAFTSIEEHLS